MHRLRKSYCEHIQGIISKYRKAGNSWPATAKQIARWAIGQREWSLSQESLVARCADDISDALREEYYTDPQGRTVRAKHAARMRTEDGQMTLWADIRTASRKHIEVAFQQRRTQIVGDCRQLKTDVDSFNDNVATDKPIQLILDFTDDVLELEALRQAS